MWMEIHSQIGKDRVTARRGEHGKDRSGGTRKQSSPHLLCSKTFLIKVGTWARIQKRRFFLLFCFKKIMLTFVQTNIKYNHGSSKRGNKHERGARLELHVLRGLENTQPHQDRNYRNPRRAHLQMFTVQKLHIRNGGGKMSGESGSISTWCANCKATRVFNSEDRFALSKDGAVIGRVHVCQLCRHEVVVLNRNTPTQQVFNRGRVVN